MSAAKLPSLTSFRGIAALIVLLHHATAFYLPKTGAFIAQHSGIILKGYLCVDFFFILSGFILAYLYQERFCREKIGPSYRNFLLARFARTYPLHLVMLLAILGLGLARIAAEIHSTGVSSYLASENFQALRFAGHDTVYTFFQNLFMLQALQFESWASWNEPAWSVGAEWIAYLLFPAIVIPATRFRTMNGILCIPIVLTGLFLLERGQASSLNSGGLVGTGRCLLEFWLGVTALNLWRTAFAKNYLSGEWLMVAALLTCAYVMHAQASDLLAIIPFAVLLIASSRATGPLTRFINSRPLVLLGELSYSIYMTHWFLIGAVLWLWKGVTGLELQDSLGESTEWAALILSLVAMILFSWVTYRYIEMPWRSRLRPGH